MTTRMQQRRGTAAEWQSANTLLAEGEIGYETDTGKVKIGDGSTAWNSLNYFADVESLIDGAPETLDTLNELAAAINDDPSFFTTITDTINNLDALPSQTNEAGKYLTTNGSEASWATITSDPTNDIMKSTLFFGGRA